MQAGHLAVPLIIASYAPELSAGQISAFSAESIGVSFAAHWFANFDGIPIMFGWVKKSFHCTWSHTILFALLLSFIAWLINPAWFMLVLVGSLGHLLTDMPSSVGLPVLLPFSKKRFTLNLWADTGILSWESFKGTYLQAWTWILEGGAFLVLFIRAYQEAVWPFM
jgi:membrane-bound metal-dependent hydrolase YbcI (DUF457 family)